MKRIAIIGGGLAGTACAYVLRQAGLVPVIYEAGPHLAPGASGNPIGLYNPRLSARRTPESDFYSAAFSLAHRAFRELDDIDWNPCSALHLITGKKKEKQLSQTIQTWNWPEESMQLLSAREASEVAGVELQQAALYLPDSGFVSPKKLCERYATDIEVSLNTKIKSVSDIKADAIILACGMGVKKFEETRDLPLAPVRGQVTTVKATEKSRELKCSLSYDGYVLPEKDGTHMLGATFERNVSHSDIRGEDDGENIAALAGILPDIANDLEVAGHRASARTTSKDHFPVIGQIHDCKDLYVSTAHSAYGIVGSIAGAHLITDMILDRPLSLANDVVQKLNPVRFLV